MKNKEYVLVQCPDCEGRDPKCGHCLGKGKVKFDRDKLVKVHKADGGVEYGTPRHIPMQGWADYDPIQVVCTHCSAILNQLSAEENWRHIDGQCISGT